MSRALVGWLATLGVVNRRRTTAPSSAPTARLGLAFAKSTKSRCRLIKHGFATTMLDPRSGRSGVFAKISTATRRPVTFGMFDLAHPAACVYSLWTTSLGLQHRTSFRRQGQRSVNSKARERCAFLVYIGWRLGKVSDSL
jgi:hypothetical protein